MVSLDTLGAVCADQRFALLCDGKHLSELFDGRARPPFFRRVADDRKLGSVFLLQLCLKLLLTLF